MLVNLNAPILPPFMRGVVAVGPLGVPRFWATIWCDVLKAHLEPSTRRKHLSALDRLYEAVERRYGHDCLDRIIAHLDVDTIQDCLVGFLAQLRNEAAISQVDRSSTWTSAVNFVTDVLRYAGHGSDHQASQMEAKLLRLDTLYRQLLPNPQTAVRAVRALPPSVVRDLYEVFRPNSPRNPFKTEALRWRNLLIFMLLLRLGLRRGEAALLHTTSFKEDFDPESGEVIHWLDVDETDDDDPRHEQPSLKTGMSRRQLPLSSELVELARYYTANFRGKANYPHLFMSQKAKPLALRSYGKVMDVATAALSPHAQNSLRKQGLEGVSCHDLRHTSAVVRMRRYQDSGLDIQHAQEKLRVFFGWSRSSDMPRLYAKAYFETSLAEVWDEKFDMFVEALRRTIPDNARP